MRRVSVAMLGALLLLAGGCGRNSYEARLEASVDRMRYRQRLDQFLGAPPGDARFQELQVFIRPPKGMDLAKVFVMADVPKGAYDLADSFVGKAKDAPQSLHLLVRKKGLKKKPPAKGAPPEPVVERGPFEQDVLALLASVYGAGEALSEPKFQTENKKGGNSFRRVFFNSSTGNTVRAYFLKQDPYEVALVWDLPQDAFKDPTQSTARDLCLQSFALAGRAMRQFGGDLSEDDAGAASAPTSATPF